MWVEAVDTATRSAALDPTLLALMSIFGGAVLTVGAGFVGAWIQARREHTRWVRERRYEAYLAFIQFVRAIDQERDEVEHLAKRREAATKLLAELDAIADTAKDDEEREQVLALGADARRELAGLPKKSHRATERLYRMVDGVAERSAAFYLLGPAQVRDAVPAVMDRNAGAPAKRMEALDTLEARMRAALGVRG